MSTIHIQRTFRKTNFSFGSGSSHANSAGQDDASSAGDSEQEDMDHNNEEALAVRRAFMDSVEHIGHTSTRVPSSPEFWGPEQINSWVVDRLNVTIEAEDRTSAARALWCEWERVKPSIQRDVRRGIVEMVDNKLHGRGFPSLRELVYMQVPIDERRERRERPS